ncbi:MAG: hypothetical protein ACRDZO_29240 [Egibacteraceae bacterium]
MVDEDRVRRLLTLLERYRSLLAQEHPDPYRRRHLVQTAAQICIDLANHVIAADGHRVPRDYGMPSACSPRSGCSTTNSRIG